MKIPNGCVFLARIIDESDVWCGKPSWWLKVWLHILMRVNHKKQKGFNRGQAFFSRDQIHLDCHLRNDRVKAKSVDNVIRWLKSTTRITTRKTTRGIVITVCNYDKYQDIDNYRNDTGNDRLNDLGTTQERHRNDTINNNDKNDKNEKKKKKGISVPTWDEFRDYALTRVQNVNQQTMRNKYEAWKLDGWKDGNGKRIKNWKSKVNHNIPYWGTQKTQEESPLFVQTEEQQETSLQQVYGMDFRLDGSHQEEWQKDADRLGITIQEYGAWRKSCGPYSKDNPMPTVDYPNTPTEEQ